MFCLITGSFLLGAFSVQKGRSVLSVLAFLLVLCVFRGGRRFLIGFRFKVQCLRFKCLRLNRRTYSLNLKHRTLNNFSSLSPKSII
ncbi:hypothetical protein D1003_04935 [Riemerella anatipestifer]|nr:hypothetical protein [Riemerella anatipestifer]